MWKLAVSILFAGWVLAGEDTPFAAMWLFNLLLVRCLYLYYSLEESVREWQRPLALQTSQNAAQTMPARRLYIRNHSDLATMCLVARENA